MAYEHTKNEMLAGLLKKAISFGIVGAYMIADAWFGCKCNILLALDCDLIAIFMMKRNKTKYRVNGELKTLKALYGAHRNKMEKQSGKGYSYFSLTAELNLAGDDKPEKWQHVKLIFTRGQKAPKVSWVVLLCSDSLLDDETIFDVYALRWSIEFYFKEIKQNLGLLKEQTGAYETHYASIHLAAIRYTLLFHIYLEHHGESFAKIRKELGWYLEFYEKNILPTKINHKKSFTFCKEEG
jgi:hypothetical protein